MSIVASLGICFKYLVVGISCSVVLILEKWEAIGQIEMILLDQHFLKWALWKVG